MPDGEEGDRARGYADSGQKADLQDRQDRSGVREGSGQGLVRLSRECIDRDARARQVQNRKPLTPEETDNTPKLRKREDRRAARLAKWADQETEKQRKQKAVLYCAERGDVPSLVQQALRCWLAALRQMRSAKIGRPGIEPDS